MLMRRRTRRHWRTPVEPPCRARSCFFEPRFGVDFGGVRVHADGESADAAKGLRARAYTIGDDIVFGDGEYAPHTSHGRRLLAHELTHVVQQRQGTASAAPQRKEVPQDKDIRGKQDWTTADRISNSARWQEACLMNLNAVDSGQYTRIVERRDFYKWFYEFTASRGYTTRWTLAASVVANGAHQIADMDDDLLSELANEELGLANVELRGAMREGNQVIFDVVLPKLKKLLDGGPLKGAAALKWDMQVLAEEQTLIQPLYDRMSKDSLQQLDDIARQSGVVGFAASLAGEDQVAALPHSKGGTVPEFTGAAITDIGARWEYGMALGNEFAPSGTGYVPGTTKMPSVGADYSSGKEFSKVATRSALHQLDAWLTSDPADTCRFGQGHHCDHRQAHRIRETDHRQQPRPGRHALRRAVQGGHGRHARDDQEGDAHGPGVCRRQLRSSGRTTRRPAEAFWRTSGTSGRRPRRCGTWAPIWSISGAVRSISAEAWSISGAMWSIFGSDLGLW